MPSDQQVVLIETNVSVGPVGVGFEQGLVEINGVPHTIHSITAALETPSIAPIDVGLKSITLNDGFGVEDLRAFGSFVEGYGGMGKGILVNDDGVQIGTYTGVRSNYAAALGISITWTRPVVEFDPNSTHYQDMTTAPCFPAGTKVAVSGRRHVLIERIEGGSDVLAFPEFGSKEASCINAVDSELVDAKVVQTFSNVTEEWIELHFTDPRTGDATSLTATPGHVMLTPEGDYKQLVQMIEAQRDAPSLDAPTDVQRLGYYAGAVELVSADSHIVTAHAWAIQYSAATAHLYEEAEMLVTRTEGGLAVEPEVKKGWKTYNFEVEKYHTYVAGGIRVHNQSEIASYGYGGNIPVINDYAAVQDGRFGDILGDYGAYQSNGDFAFYDASLDSTLYTFESNGQTHIHTKWNDSLLKVDDNFWDGIDGYSNNSGASKSDWTSPNVNVNSTWYDAQYDSSQIVLPGSNDNPGSSTKPILIDLDGDGVELAPQDLNFTVFDFDDDGFKERTAWVGADDALLVFDDNLDGDVTVDEFAFSRLTEEDDTDLEALATLFDTNNDGVLDAQDEEWAKFRVWQDANSDGIVDAGELRSLSDKGIVSLNLSYSDDSSSYVISDGSVVHGLADVTWQDGSVYELADVALHHDTFGIKTTVEGYTTRYTLESGAEQQTVTFTPAQASGQIDHTGLTSDDLVRVTGLIGNELDNTLDASLAETGVSMSGQAGNDSLIGSAQDDSLSGGDGDDQLTGGDGGDLLKGGAGADVLLGGLGDDVLFVDADDLASGTIDGGDGFDALIVEGDQGVSLVMEDLDVEHIQTGAGDDTIHVMSDRGDDTVIDPTTGELYRLAESTQSERFVTYIADAIRGGGMYGNGEPYFVSQYTQQYTTINITSEYLNDEGSLAWYIDGDDGADTILKSFFVSSGLGDDVVNGSFADDRISGDEGNDYLAGSSGNDVYFFSAGDGNDTVVDIGRSASASQTTHYVGWSYYQITGWRTQSYGSDQNEYTSAIITGSRTQTGNHEYTTQAIDFVDAHGGIDTIAFGGALRLEDLGFVFDQSVDNDLRIDVADPETGAVGTDSITIENFFNDLFAVELLSFSNGMSLDITNVDIGTGTAGDDTLTIAPGDTSNQFYRGFDGNDTLTSGDGVDLLYGGAGDDVMQGGAGDDAYYYTKGDGNDRLADSDGIDSLFFGRGITFDDLSFNLDGTDLIIGVSETVDDVTTAIGEIWIEAFDQSATQIDRLVFDDGSVLYAAQMVGLAIASSTDDTVTWTGSQIWMDGGDGNDTVSAGDADDYLVGGAGTDQLSGGAGNDVLDAGEGIAGQVQVLDGGLGDDTYVYTKTVGTTQISGEDVSSGSDTVYLTDLLMVDVSLSIVQDQGLDWLEIGWSDGTDSGSLRIADHGQHIERIVFADGTTVSAIDLTVAGVVGLSGTAEADVIASTDGSDVISGGADDDAIFALDGADTIDGGDGDDFLSGGVGNDHLVGGTGADTFFFARGDNVDTVNDGGTDTDSIDQLVFADDIGVSDVTVEYTLDQQSFVLKLDGTADAVVLENMRTSPNGGVDEVVFSDGTVWDATKLDAMAAANANADPQANADGPLTGYQDNPITVAASSLLANDTDANNDVLTIQTVQAAVNGTVALDSNGDVEFTPAAGYTGPASFTYTVSDGNGGVSTAQVDLVVEDPTPVPVVLERRIASSADDVEEDSAGVVDLDSGDIELVDDNTWNGPDQTIGLRFTNLDIPQGAIITSAWLQFQVDEVDSGTTSLEIRAQDADDAGQFTTATNDVSSRPTTAASVAWQPAAWTVVGEAGADQRTPDLKSLVQEIVDRQGWSSNNDMAFIITGTGERTAESYDSDASVATLLHVEYHVPGSSSSNATAGNDVLTGSSSNDTIDGLAGNDVLIGGAGADVLDGGTGTDTASYATAQSGIYIHTGDMSQNTGDAAGDSYISIEAVEGTSFDDTLIGNLTLVGGAGNDTFYGTSLTGQTISGGDGNDVIHADAGDDVLNGGSGDDTVIGYGGNDQITLGDGDDYSAAGDGNDTIDGGAGADEIRAGAGDDIIFGGAGNDSLHGDDGNDTIHMGPGDDYANGGAGDDLMFAGSGADDFDGGAGTDTVSYANATAGVLVHTGDWNQNTGDAAGDSYNSIEVIVGSDFDDDIISNAPVLNGGAGNDYIYVFGGGNVTIDGGAGNDTIDADDGADVLNGGSGDDSVIGYGGDDQITLGDGDDYSFAGDGNDTIDGGAGEDELRGGDGNDTLRGGDGDDSLHGGDGDDVIDFGAGDDYATGGAGNDTFIFRSGYGYDSIAGFEGGAGTGDVVEIDAALASDFADLQNYMDDWGGTTTFLDFGNGDILEFFNTTEADLNADDFRFVA